VVLIGRTSPLPIGTTPKFRERTMAKRAAIRQQKRKAEKATHRINGIVVDLNPIDPIWIQQVMNSIEVPEVPTYTTKIAGGGTQTHELDAETAAEDPETLEVWTKYVRERDMAVSEQSGLAVRALILDGTTPPDDWEDIAANYFRRMRIIGTKLASDQEERWVDYVDQTLTQDQKMDLSTALMRISGVPEEVVADARDSFRTEIQDRGETLDDEVDGSDVPDAEREMAA